MESGPTQAVLLLVGLAAEKVIRDRYSSRIVYQFYLPVCNKGAPASLTLISSKANGNATTDTIRQKLSPIDLHGSGGSHGMGSCPGQQRANHLTPSFDFPLRR
ncbi:MAG: hypothetical protein R6U98_06865 [Pirellulaceae bacterium]